MGHLLDRRLDPQPGECEIWTLDLISDDRELALVTELGLLPDGTGWFWLLLWSNEHGYVAVVDDELRLPKPPSMEIRASGLWAEFCVQAPDDHFTVDVEAFGVGLDDPRELLGSAYGIRVPIATELSWDTVGPLTGDESTTTQPARVHGEILLGDATLEILGAGWRSHWRGEGRPSLRACGASSTNEPAVFGGSRETDDEESIVLDAPVPAGANHQLVAVGPAMFWRRS